MTPAALTTLRALFLSAAVLGVTAPAVCHAADRETVFWQSIQNSADPADFEAYLDRYPGGAFAALARNRIAQIATGGRAGGSVFGDTAPDFLFPDSDRRRLSSRDLRALSAAELRIARNEIYARHGYVFDSPDLDRYFRQTAWYRPSTRNVSLNAVEQANVDLIKAYER